MQIYFAHPYSTLERPQNRRHNGLLRQHILKGVSIERYRFENVLAFADEPNGLPHMRLADPGSEERSVPRYRLLCLSRIWNWCLGSA